MYKIINFDENIEIRLEEQIFDIDIEEQVVENSVQLERVPRVTFKD